MGNPFEGWTETAPEQPVDPLDGIARKLLGAICHDNPYIDKYGLEEDPDEYDETLAVVKKALTEVSAPKISEEAKEWLVQELMSAEQDIETQSRRYERSHKQYPTIAAAIEGHKARVVILRNICKALGITDV